ncbi:MAG: DUF2357 domain-containing protein [Bacillaceae bacterium]|nr:DUF2357 domain-containing protein [Bacillaceae bacterium]
MEILAKREVQLLHIEHNDFSLYLKGKPYNQRFQSLHHYRKKAQLDLQSMILKVDGVDEGQARVFDPIKEELVSISEQDHPPIFFENEVYQLVITPKTSKNLSFYHENPQIRDAVDVVGEGPTQLLMGQLQFMNEVGLTTFEIHDEKGKLVEITIELFPTKLDYKEDYQRLLDEVSEEIYNLAFHFMKKTFLGASKISSDKPSLVEFYQLLNHYFDRFVQSIRQIERQPHHELQNHYRKVRGDQLRHLDSWSRNYLRKQPNLFKEVSNGVQLGDTIVMPEKGYHIKKVLSYDTLENRFVKFVIQRLVNKIENLRKKVEQYIQNNPDGHLTIIERMNHKQKSLEAILKQPFWRGISQLDRSVMSLVMQMQPGYRDAYRIYLVLSQGLSLQGEMFKMSVKDVATLYEYWTYLKIGQILNQKYDPVSQDIVKVRRNGLFVDLDQTKKAKRVFKHPKTGERITLSFQKRLYPPTSPQKPDIMLEIEKKNTTHTYQYIFDAKYRIDFGDLDDTKCPGPLEEDINTMHRYRDAWVVKSNGPYERHAFGAYVLFPWHDEDSYKEEHPFYKSIDQVNIGGFPFLPNATLLVERFVEHLIESNPEDLQEQGILPKGALEYWQSSLDEKVLVGLVKDVDQKKSYMNSRQYTLPVKVLKKGWQEAKYVALYIPKAVSEQSNLPNGITYYGKIIDIEVSDQTIRFGVDHWRSLKETIRPVGYGIQRYIITSYNLLKYAKELPGLFIKSKEELKLWRMFRRLTKNTHVELDHEMVDESKNVKEFKISAIKIQINKNAQTIVVRKNGKVNVFSLDWLKTKPTYIFKKLRL